MSVEVETEIVREYGDSRGGVSGRREKEEVRSKKEKIQESWGLKSVSRERRMVQ